MFQKIIMGGKEQPFTLDDYTAIRLAFGRNSKEEIVAFYKFVESQKSKPNGSKIREQLDEVLTSASEAHAEGLLTITHCEKVIELGKKRLWELGREGKSLVKCEAIIAFFTQREWDITKKENSMIEKIRSFEKNRGRDLSIKEWYRVLALVDLEYLLHKRELGINP